MRSLLSLSLILLFGCTPVQDAGPDEPAGPDCDADADSDGLDDCEEAELGTDPEAADSDGDGFDDADELECVSDPLDEDEVCYACGWAHGDPGDIESTGSDVGDVSINISGIDQCGESVDLYDLAGQYRLLFMTTVWCGACKVEARELVDRTKSILDAVDVDFSYAIILFQDGAGNAPNPDNGEDYWLDVNEPPFPVLANEAQDILDATPYDGSVLPGKCVVSPAMEIIECDHGHHPDDWAADAILSHMGR
jgi:hypothetical protein